MKNLDKIPKQNPFRVPDNYFEDVSKKIIAATSEAGGKQKHPGKVIRIRHIIAIAASVAALAIIGITGLLTNTRNGNQVIASINLNSEQVLETIIYDIDILTLEQEISDSWFETGLTGLDSEEIIDYLINENIEPSEIYELL